MGDKTTEPPAEQPQEPVDAQVPEERDLGEITGGDHQRDVAPSFSALLNDQTPRGAEFREKWRKSPERATILRLRAIVVATMVVATAIATGTAYLVTENDYDRGLNVGLTAAITASVTFYLGAFVLLLRRRQLQRAWYDRVVLLRAREELSKAETQMESANLELTTLWAFTQRRLDYYHKVATSQSEKSFSYGLAAAGVGFFVILVSSVVAAFASSTAASITAGLIGLGGGGLAAYIGATFMRLQENSATHLREYFGQPLEFSRYLAAERLLPQLDEDSRPLAIRDIIRALARAPAAPEDEPPD